jgi:hypothetical protein
MQKQTYQIEDFDIVESKYLTCDSCYFNNISDRSCSVPSSFPLCFDPELSIVFVKKKTVMSDLLYPMGSLGEYVD